MFKALLNHRDDSRDQKIALQRSSGVRLPVTAERLLLPCGPETLLTARAFATPGLRSNLMLQAARTALRLSFSALVTLFVSQLLAKSVSLYLLSAVVAVLALDMIDMRMPFTHGHSRMVAELAEGAGTAVGLPIPDIRALRWSGCIHDIGELVVPVATWMRNGPLSVRERDAAQLHA
ncbi:HD-GYP domain-containing protein [Mesorhizobium australicum WSM2073]|uniref:HD-GYP domain-containing protein n=1 Tax=Mesorhizobium australicum (strain HAMBI 3006 / LMG 24608 / WSM2073) TaxID=754035 RepID=L0KK31_MESAW|nr:HD domain-containing protein [Mesorhizobium australicum]AGB44910.1 HD-GYP domain-containing protein [Mesorhizobium australicum WSM2073]